MRPIVLYLGIIWSMIFTLQAYGAGSSLTIQDAMVKKGNSGATEMEFTVYHSISAPMPVTIYYSTMDDSAKAGIDYVAKNGTVMIKPNERTTSIVVPVINNLKPTKNNKQFKVSIASSTTVTKPIAIGTILENDTQPTSAAADKNLSVTKGDSRETRK